MGAIKSRDTKPELLVRRLVSAFGYRYRLHPPDLAGKPDLTFRRRQKVIFVHGCFWHGHDCGDGAHTPAINSEFWIAKIERNKSRDRAAIATLESDGWAVLVVWECETKYHVGLAGKLKSFLG